MATFSLTKKRCAHINTLPKYGGCSSVGRALDCDSRCRGFEPHHPPHIFVTFISVKTFARSRSY